MNKTLQEEWLEAKEAEDIAKNKRMQIEEKFLKDVGYDGQLDFKNYKDEQIKVTFSKKEEYDNKKLLEILTPEDLFSEGFPFRIKLEPDAKKMYAFKYEHKDFYDKNLAPIMNIKVSKPSFSAANTGDKEPATTQSWE